MIPPDLSKSDLHLLYVFATVVEARGFSGAQIELNVSASTISRQITDLEHRLRMRLCQRGRSGFRLTEKGELVYRAAQRLFSAVQDFRETVDGSSTVLTGTLSLAVIDDWVFSDRSPFARALRQFVDHAPDVTIELFSLAPDNIEMAVQDGRAALGVGVFHRQKSGLIYQDLTTERIDLFCAKGHPLFDAVTAKDIEHGLSETRYARRTYLRERHVAQISHGLNRSGHAHQIEGVAHLILTGRYIGYLPVDFADMWVRDDRMRAVGGGQYGQPSQLRLVRKRGADPSRVTQSFETLLFGQIAG